ncbi:MAG: hypothetical protein Q7R40_18795 [Phaeospirillum sp.]|nr:hypothetical protein [Phaeospirillum sp.]
MVTDFAGEAIPGSGKPSASPLSFHIALMHGGDKKAGIEWAKDWAGLTGRAPEALKSSRAALSRFDERPQDDAAAIAIKRKRAKAIYLSDTLPWPGTPADLYYRGRGLDLSRLPFPAGAPRFRPKCFCGALGKPGNDPGAYLPAIILPYHAMDGTLLAVHRTYLGEADGQWVKSPLLKRSKLSYGEYAGGIIPLWAGTRALDRTGVIAHGQSLGKANGLVRIHLVEGPEDGWSVALANAAVSPVLHALSWFLAAPLGPDFLLPTDGEARRFVP